MKLRHLLFAITLILIPALCLAAPKKPKTAAQTDRALKAVARVEGDSRRRVALVIGNGSYVSSPLKNPVNDARAMAAVLRRLGFEVVERTNLSNAAMNEVIETFGEKLQPGGVALFYYAGHGMQVGGANYLIPVDARINKENEIRYKAVDAGLVLAKMESAKSDVNIAIMDACRDNPFSRSFRSAAKGLAQVDAPSGTLIAFATAPGKTAADGDGNNGVYTEALIQSIETPGMSLEHVFKQVRKRVLDKTAKIQTPWESSSLVGDFYFIPPTSMTDVKPVQPSPPAATAPPPSSGSLDDIIADSEAAERSKKERTEHIKADVAKYRKILTTRPELKQTAWDALLNSYPEARNAPVGELGKFMKAVGMKVSENFIDRATGMEFVAVPEGCGTIGGSQVCFDPFSIGKYEVTQGQWKKVMGSNPSHFSSCGDNCPVENVSWNDTQQFIQRLNQQSGTSYRLPTEAEWEYACRTGGTEEYCGGNDINAVAWHKDNSGSQTHPVGQKQANAWGIHDMSGNVMEWVQDWYDSRYPSATKNPTGPSSGQYRVLRGGSWTLSGGNTSPDFRLAYPPSRSYGRGGHGGFRLALPVQ